MKVFCKRFFLFSAALWLFFGICPLLPAQRTPTRSTAAPDRTDTYRIYDESTGAVHTVSETDFLPCALLCELPPDAPEEAIKAQIIAMHTTCTRMRAQNAETAYDFTCNSETRTVYAPPEVFSEIYGDEWAEIFEHIQNLCRAVENDLLCYAGEVIAAPYFAVSCGSTQSYADAWNAEDLPYLQAVPCPADRLHSRFRTVHRLTPTEVQSAFPTVSFTDAPENWFSAPQTNAAGYVTQITLCGTKLTGTQIRTALSLNSSAFRVQFDGAQFVFTADGHGHGVGMSQSTAVYMAEHGASYTEILSYFYPGTELCKNGSDL